jgi:hypothetical protein
VQDKQIVRIIGKMTTLAVGPATHIICHVILTATLSNAFNTLVS